MDKRTPSKGNYNCLSTILGLMDEHKALSSVDPQPDNYVAFSKEVFLALMQVNFKYGRTKDVIDFVVRKTWGWKDKKADKISVSKFVEALNIKLEGKGSAETIVKRCIKEAVDLNIIFKVGTEGELNWLAINKYYDTWKCDINVAYILKEVYGENGNNTTGDANVEPEVQPEPEPIEPELVETVQVSTPKTDTIPNEEKERYLKELDRIESMKAPDGWENDDYELKSFEVAKLTSDFHGSINAIEEMFAIRGIKKSEMYQEGLRWMGILRKVLPAEWITQGKIYGRTFEVRQAMERGE
jgi:hypothetical protein